MKVPPSTLHVGWFRQRVLILVRTYPTPATSGAEVSCTAGITESGQWVRLFPIPYRFLDPDKQFSKYQWIDVNIKKAPSDARPESYRIDRDSIRIVAALGSQQRWRDRKAILNPLRAHCQCCLSRQYQVQGAPTLGFFKPKRIVGLEIEATNPNWTLEELAKLRQQLPQMFGDQNRPKKELEKIPFIFRYQFECNEEDCNGHKMMCADWEVAQLYRNCRRRYGINWETKFRQHVERDMIERSNTHFFVGTVHRYGTWIIVGLFYPPRDGSDLIQTSFLDRP